MIEYKDFISKNVAPKEIKRIGLYDSKGNRIISIPLGGLKFPTNSAKLYSFGALSDIHLQYSTAKEDFQKALTYLNETEDVVFTCIAGDLTSSGREEELAEYKSYVDTYSADTPVYAIVGNHDSYTLSEQMPNVIGQYTGQPLYYSFNYGNDVFIMIGTIGGESHSNGVVFADGTLQWLYETLETNRNRRCFVFQHIFAGVENEPICGNANGLYTNWCWHHTDECIVFENLMKHYKNTIWFHGHSHLRFSKQEFGCLYANYSDEDGYRSVHIPSLAVPRDDENKDGTVESIYAKSEGYVVDVYENGMHLRGREFAEGEFLPIASYWLDTTLKSIDACTYIDSTGTINTINEPIN